MKYIILILTLLLCGCPVQDSPAPPGPKPAPVPEPTPEPTPKPSPVVLEPSDEMKELVSKVEQVEDKELVGFYLAFADLVSRDSEVIQTTGQIRTAHSRAGRLAFQKTGIQGKYPGLAEAIDEALMKSIGKKNQNLTDELRAKAVETFKAIAWALQ